MVLESCSSRRISKRSGWRSVTTGADLSRRMSESDHQLDGNLPLDQQEILAKALIGFAFTSIAGHALSTLFGHCRLFCSEPAATSHVGSSRFQRGAPWLLAS